MAAETEYSSSLTCRVPETLLDDVDKIAKRNRRKRSEILREALEILVRAEKRKAKRKAS